MDKIEKEAAIKFLEDMGLYWRNKARDSQEDIEIQAWHKNAENCIDIIRLIHRNA